MKKFFIKKSEYLLEVFTKGVQRNLKYFQEHPLEPIEIQQKPNADKTQESKVKEIIGYFKNGKIALFQTTSDKVVQDIIRTYGSNRCLQIIKSQDPRLVDFLKNNEYTILMRTCNRYWDVTNQPWVKDITNTYKCEQIFPMSQEEAQNQADAKKQQHLSNYKICCQVIAYLQDETNIKTFVDTLINEMANKLDYREKDGYGEDYIKPFKKKICGFNIVASNKNTYGVYEGCVYFNLKDLSDYIVKEIEWYYHGEPSEPEETYNYIYSHIKKIVDFNIYNTCLSHKDWYEQKYPELKQ